ncbi:MAG: hypothetical protein ACI8PZ_005244, partial [Myxococcota bacterium]
DSEDSGELLRGEGRRGPRSWGVLQQLYEEASKVRVIRAFLLRLHKPKTPIVPPLPPASNSLPVNAEAASLLHVGHPIRRHEDDAASLDEAVWSARLVATPSVEDAALPV